MKTSWRDLIITSPPSAVPQRGSFGNLRNIDPQKHHQRSSALPKNHGNIEAETPAKTTFSLYEPKKSTQGGNFEDFEPRYDFLSSSLNIDSLQNLNSVSISSISSKPLPTPIEVESPHPLLPGWLVAYRDQRGQLSGGCEDRKRGTVSSCDWNGSRWVVTLTNGEMMPLQKIVSVGKPDQVGRIVAAWTVKEHGYDGESHQPG